jgi:hypothetical protein
MPASLLYTTRFIVLIPWAHIKKQMTSKKECDFNQLGQWIACVKSCDRIKLTFIINCWKLHLGPEKKI